MFEGISEQSTLYIIQNGKLTTKFSKCDIEQLSSILMKMEMMRMSHCRILDRTASKMIRFRFFEVMKYLHFNDNSKAILNRESPSYDQLYKVRPLLEQF
ncbi:hypothetical protein T09_12708, partial [Trichinella sp. T9]